MVSPDWIRLRKNQWRSMLEHVLGCLPEEACGLLGGVSETVLYVRPIKNISGNPDRFQMDPEEQIEVMFEIEERGHQIVAIYHSHPLGPECPSEVDIRQAAYPEAAYIIWYPSVENWNCRAYLMMSEGFEEIPIVLDP